MDFITGKETYSQCSQDAWALHETESKKDGYFVDFGATDGITINNTYLLESKYNWKGIVAEPNSVYHEALKQNRNCHISTKCVFTESNRTIPFIETEASDLSTIKGFGKNDEHASKRLNGIIKEVETITLLDLLNSYNAPEQIDYLSIDTEGSEYAILNTFFANNTKYSIKCMTIEHNYISRMRQMLYDLMTSKGYIRKYTEISKCDDFYILEK